MKYFLAVMFLTFSTLAVANAGSSYYRYPAQPRQTATNIKLKKGTLPKFEKPPWYKRFWKWLKGKRFFWFALIIGAAKLIKETVINDYKKTKKNNNK